MLCIIDGSDQSKALVLSRPVLEVCISSIVKSDGYLDLWTLRLEQNFMLKFISGLDAGEQGYSIPSRNVSVTAGPCILWTQFSSPLTIS